MNADAFVKQVEDRSLRVAVVGLGYVGLPLVRSFLNAGFRCLGLDVDSKKIEKLNKGRSYIKHIPSADFASNLRAGRFHATTDPRRLRTCGAILICVPTPLTETREPDMRFVKQTSEMISKNLRRGQLVSLESTTYPGTTRELVAPILESSGLKAEKDFLLAYSPEREDPGRVDFSTDTIPKLVGGVGSQSLRAATALYGAAITEVVPVSSCEVAEAAKILENVYRAVNIAMINELKMLFDRMGIDVWEVIEAAATKPFGFQPFYPGPGLGGHCIPIDPFYLTWKARAFDMSTRFIELAGEINTQMPDYVIARLGEALNQRRKSIKGSKVLVLGLAYKKDVDDIRESPSVQLIEKLQALGARVDYNDPHIPRTPEMRQHSLKMRSKKLSPAMLRSYDCVLIATDHSVYDYDMIVRNAKLIVDTRNATANCRGRASKVVKA